LQIQIQVEVLKTIPIVEFEQTIHINLEREQPEV